MTFWARGEIGGEVCEFCFAGIDCRRAAENDQPAPDSNCRYVDSTERISTELTSLSNHWKRYCLDLRGKNLQNIIGGFCCIVSALPNVGGATIYLDDIVIHHSRLQEPRLIRSYQVGKQLLKFGDREVPYLRNVCYIHDNALAINALLASGSVSDRHRARTIADAFVALAAYSEGSSRRPVTQMGFAGAFLHRGYSCGDLFGWQSSPENEIGKATVARNSPPSSVQARMEKERAPRLPGWENPGGEENPDPESVPWLIDGSSKSINTGDMAWAILGLLNVWAAEGSAPDSAYLPTAEKLGRWLVRHCRVRPRNIQRGSLGFHGGVEWREDSSSLLKKSYQ